MLRRLRCVAVAFVSLIAVDNAWAVVQYTVTDLGRLPGRSTAEAHAISGNGLIAGWSGNDININGDAFLWSKSDGMQRINKLPTSNFSKAWGVNDAGQVIGLCYYGTSNNSTRAFLWSADAGTRDLGTLGGQQATASGINNNGQVVGSAMTSTGRWHAYCWSDGAGMQDLGAPTGATDSTAAANSDDGWIAGSAVVGGSRHPFLWSSATGWQDLGTLGGPANWAASVNDDGQVAGTGQTLGRYHPIFWSGSTGLKDLGTFGGSNGWAFDINNGGQVVGYAANSAGNYRAFLWSGATGLQDLNSLIPAGSGWSLAGAYAISDSGQIVGTGWNPSGQVNAFLLTPVPEPSTLVLLGIGAACLLGCTWRRARSQRFLGSAVIALLAVTVGVAQADVFNMGPSLKSLEMVAVGDPGNAADATGYGAVDYTYNIGKYDVTAAQYTQFLNAVAHTDPYGLYNSAMFSNVAACGIYRYGSSGSYTYGTTKKGDFPVNSVTWGSAARFCNWLHNGQPTGSEGEVTTETGAYALNGAVSTSALMAVTSNPQATYFIPSEDEWYKAAYYKGGGTSAGYWAYPTQSDSAPSNLLSAAGTNNANFHDVYNTKPFSDPSSYVTCVGAFAASPGPYGTLARKRGVVF